MEEELEEESLEDEEETPTKEFNIVSSIIVFGLISVIMVFVSALIIGSINNYALADVYNILSDYATSGLIPASFVTSADLTVANSTAILNYLDYVWFASFIGFAVSCLVLSYYRTREGFFSMFTYIVFGLIIVIYIGGMFMQITTWFKDDILFAVFPQLSTRMIFLSWYINNTGIINLILLSLMILINFVPFDLLKHRQRKEQELNFDEI